MAIVKMDPTTALKSHINYLYGKADNHHFVFAGRRINEKEFHQENRASLCQSLAPGSLLLLFSGHAPRKTGDEDYPYFADRSFVYYTGIEQQDSILAILVDKESVQEMLFMLPPDAHAERWNGKRLSPQEAQDVSGISDFRYLTDFLLFG